MFPFPSSPVSRRSLVLLAALSAVSLAVPSRRAGAEPEPEPTRTSRVVSVILPDGARRLPNTGPVTELATHLETVAKEGKFTLGPTETLAWTGGADTRDDVIRALKKANYSYEVAGEKKGEGGTVTLFVAGQKGEKNAVLGVWLAGDATLMLTWGTLSPAGARPAGTARTAAPAPEKLQPAARPASGQGQLAGKWGFTSISGTTYWDRNTGAYLGGGTGGSQTYTFDGKGGYKLFNYVKSRTYGWTIQTLTWEEGTVRIEGDRITLTPTSGKYEVKDDRVAKNNYTRPMTAEEIRKNAKTSLWSREQDPQSGAPCLMMGSARDKMIRYRRAE